MKTANIGDKVLMLRHWGGIGMPLLMEVITKDKKRFETDSNLENYEVYTAKTLCDFPETTFTFMNVDTFLILNKDTFETAKKIVDMYYDQTENLDRLKKMLENMIYEVK